MPILTQYQYNYYCKTYTCYSRLIENHHKLNCAKLCCIPTTLRPRAPHICLSAINYLHTELHFLSPNVNVVSTLYIQRYTQSLPTTVGFQPYTMGLHIEIHVVSPNENGISTLYIPWYTFSLPMTMVFQTFTYQDTRSLSQQQWCLNHLHTKLNVVSPNDNHGVSTF